MSKKKKILLMLAKGGVSQSEAAAALHASKRDVSACARVLRERSLTFDDVSAMGVADVEGMLAPAAGTPAESEFTPISLTPSTPPKRPPAHASPRTPRG